MKYIKTSQVYDQKNYYEMTELHIKYLQDSYINFDLKMKVLCCKF